MSWRTQGVYGWRTRKPHAPLGLPFLGRHWAYVGQSSSRYHRDRQHLHGGGQYGAVEKSWSDLDPKVYPLPCILPSWKWSRLVCERFWTLVLWPVYPVQGNGWNPRRIKPRTAERQRWARDARRAKKFGRGFLVDIRVTLGRLIVKAAILAILGVTAWNVWLR